jgi:hypothetical protein
MGASSLAELCLRARMKREDQEMPQLPLILAIISALLIAGGRIGRRWPVAVAGYVLLVVAGLVVLFLR